MNMSVTERRFRDGTGEKYLSDGVTVRCQAVSKTKLARIRERENNSDLTPEQAWPEAQCAHPAMTGKLLCDKHGGASELAPAFEPMDAMPVDLREKLQALVDNPSVLSRRFEISQLVAQYLVLYEKLRDNEALGKSAIEDIREGLQQIADGNVKDGAAQIAAALEARETEAEIYGQIHNIFQLLKDMTRVEVQSLKDLGKVVTIEQFIAAMDGMAADLQEALDRYVPDKRTRQLVAGFVDQRVARRFNTGSARVLSPAENIVDADAVPAAEQVAE